MTKTEITSYWKGIDFFIDNDFTEEQSAKLIELYNSLCECYGLCGATYAQDPSFDLLGVLRLARFNNKQIFVALSQSDCFLGISDKSKQVLLHECDLIANLYDAIFQINTIYYKKN